MEYQNNAEPEKVGGAQIVEAILRSMRYRRMARYRRGMDSAYGVPEQCSTRGGGPSFGLGVPVHG